MISIKKINSGKPIKRHILDPIFIGEPLLTPTWHGHEGQKDQNASAQQ